VVAEGRQGLQDVEGNESYLVEAVATLPPPLGGLDDLQRDAERSGQGRSFGLSFELWWGYGVFTLQMFG